MFNLTILFYFVVYSFLQHPYIMKLTHPVDCVIKCKQKYSHLLLRLDWMFCFLMRYIYRDNWPTVFQM